MSSYIIAGSADSIDTAYCEEIARRIKAKYKNIDFRIVIKHPSEWEEYLQQICRIYGFLKKSNPIIYTFDGKIIGNKEAFMSATAKYFGLDEESLNVENLTNEVNMKIATEQINRKHTSKNNIKTLTQKIETQYENLLKKNILKHQLKQKKQYLTNGIEYIHRTVKGIVPNISFTKKKEISLQVEQVIASDIDLMMISQNDQIKVEEQPNTILGPPGKEAFVTANEKNNSEHDRMSEVSRTNKMHESMISYDKDSKQMKESSKSKLRIDEQIDDVPDYIDYPMDDVVVSELLDGFYVGFNKNTHIAGEMIFYHNEETTENLLRVHNDGRPVKGHRVLVREIYFDGENALLEGESQILKNQQALEQNQEEDQDEPKEQNEQEGSTKEVNIQVKIQQIKKQVVNPHPKTKGEGEKIKTEPNLPLHQTSNKNIINDDDALSQIQSDLNLVSYLNHHTLFIQKPLSTMEIKNLLYFINDTDAIGCLQFLGENPNPKVKLYHRKLLLETQKQDKLSLLLPVQRFIEKQLEDMQMGKIEVPNQKCYDYEPIQNEEKFQLLQINDLGFEHYLYQLPSIPNSQAILKMLKYTIDQMLSLEEQLKKQVGYNLIITKKFILIVPLSEPYEVYNENKLYFDGLAYLGFIHTADLLQPYQLNKKPIKNMGNHLKQLLHYCANVSQDI